MKILLKQVMIADPGSPYNGSVKDVLIANDTIEKIDDDISQADEEIQFENARISPGWVDIFAHFNDPGYEYKETLETGAAGAAAGGYTRVLILPNTNPFIHNKP